MPKKPIPLTTRSWRSWFEALTADLKGILEESDNRELFANSYLGNVAAKRAKVNALYYKLLTIGLILLLFLAISSPISQIEINLMYFRINIPPQGNNILIMIYAFLTAGSSTCYVYSQYLKSICDVCINHMISDKNEKEYFELRYYGNMSDLFQGYIRKFFDMPQLPETDNKNVFWSNYSVLIYATFIITFVTLGIAYTFLIFVLNGILLMETYTNISWDRPLSIASSILLPMALVYSVASGLIASKLPCVDYSNLNKIEQMQKEEPQKYREWQKERSEYAEKARKRGYTILSILLFVGFSYVHIYTTDAALSLSGLSIIWTLVYVVFCFGSLSFLGEHIRTFSLKWFYLRNEESPEAQTKRFSKCTRGALIVYLLISLGYAYLASHMLIIWSKI